MTAGLRVAFWAAMVAGLAIRVAIISQTAGLGATITDEQHYVAIASNILERQTFAGADGQPTSIRPPLYPALVALVWSVTSAGDLQAVRYLQVALSAITVGLVFLIGRLAFSRPAAAVASAIVWLYPSLIFFNVTILTETLYTLLLTLFLVLGVRLVQKPTTLVAIGCGLALGLATLTRSVLWPLPLVLCPLLALAIPGTWKQRLAVPFLVFLAFSLTILPWAVRNTRLQGVTTIVDTMGGINLRMGNYEHTPDDRMWDAVSLRGNRNWVYGIDADFDHAPTEGEKDKWAQRRAVAYMLAHPATTARRAAIKFGDFWGIEREFVAGVQGGLFAPPSWFVWIAAGLTALSCVLLMLTGAAGVWLAPVKWREHLLLLLPVLAITAAHTIVFGHSRYHIPLVPVLALYAAALVTPRLTGSVTLRSLANRAGVAARLGAAVTTVLLLGIWGRELLFVEGPRLRAFWQMLN